jgi:hypothetical protein
VNRRCTTYLTVSVVTLLLCPLASAQTADATRPPAPSLFAGTWEVDREPSTRVTSTNCPTLQFTFVSGGVTVGCASKDASGQEVTTVDLYHAESVYPLTRHQGSFPRVLIDPRILEFHDFKEGSVVRVRWYELSSDGEMITATSRENARTALPVGPRDAPPVLIYRRRQ